MAYSRYFKRRRYSRSGRYRRRYSKSGYRRFGRKRRVNTPFLRHGMRNVFRNRKGPKTGFFRDEMIQNGGQLAQLFPAREWNAGDLLKLGATGAGVLGAYFGANRLIGPVGDYLRFRNRVSQIGRGARPDIELGSTYVEPGMEKAYLDIYMETLNNDDFSYNNFVKPHPQVLREYWQTVNDYRSGNWPSLTNYVNSRMNPDPVPLTDVTVQGHNEL